MTIQIAYVSQDGQTAKVSQFLQQKLTEFGYTTKLIDIINAPETGLDPETRLLVIGVPVRYGKPMPQIQSWLSQHKQPLPELAAFCINLTARKPEKSRPETSPYTKKLAAILPAKAVDLEIFAGALDYQKYNWIDRKMIQFIMWMTNGPVHSDQRIEYTDWQRVEEFARRLADHINR